MAEPDGETGELAEKMRLGAVGGPMGVDAGLGGTLLAFEQMAVAAGAVVVRETGERIAEEASPLVAALDAAAAAAAAGAGGLQCGPALVECAELLARRARALTNEAAGIADGMDRAAAMLVTADEEVGGRVAGAAG